MTRKDLVKHDEEKTNGHLLLMKSALTDIQNKLANTEQRLASAELKLEASQAEPKLEHKFQSKSEILSMQNQIDELEATLKQKLNLLMCCLDNGLLRFTLKQPSCYHVINCYQ